MVSNPRAWVKIAW